jgi:2-oxoglutarate dehydrogenase E1 component
MSGEMDSTVLQQRVDQLVRNFRVLGHLAAEIDPLGRTRDPVPELDPATYGFTSADLQRQFSIASTCHSNPRTLEEIVGSLRNTYCKSIGVQLGHIEDSRIQDWLLQRIETTENHIALTQQQQRWIYDRLYRATAFEQFLLKRFCGSTTYSLEGAETLIPLLDLAIDKSAEQDVDEIVFGMAHRGRLNVLANIFEMPLRTIFGTWISDDAEAHSGSGNAKFDLGYSTDRDLTDGRKIRLTLCSNPSHVEFVNTVALGRVRSRQDRRGDVDRKQVMCMLIHGDAAFAGQGTVQETLNLCQLEATWIGGTVHVILNNQIGFTTGPKQSRSTTYATDVARMLNIPIFHVNGDDPDAVAQVVQLALDFRQEFRRDVVIDMCCYRLRGHVEADDPAPIHPLMYRQISAHKNVGNRYLDMLLAQAKINREEAACVQRKFQQEWESELRIALAPEFKHSWDVPQGIWHGYAGGAEAGAPDIETGVDAVKLGRLLDALTRLPEGFHPHRKIDNADSNRASLLQRRMKMARGEQLLDWATAEALAFATLSLDGHRVRLHGQDVERGALAQRHAILHDSETGETYMPLAHLSSTQAPIEIHNSCLSDIGVLGYEYGYSLDAPDALVCWEPMFGDYANAAQVIIDQFLVSAEHKWNLLSGLVLLLPHGFDGGGPEHSSARLERFLALSSDDNIQVVHATTPAQVFHLLRRQILRTWRKPLVVLTPKNHLRSQLSSLDELATGTFRRVLSDNPEIDPAGVKKILLCSGSVYFDLLSRRATTGRTEVAILRLEQLYPFPNGELKEILAAYPESTPVTYVQEEPENAGAWGYLRMTLGERLFGKYPLHGIYRPRSSSPGSTSFRQHERQLECILTAAVGERGNQKC